MIGLNGLKQTISKGQHPYPPAYDYVVIWTPGSKFYLIKKPMTGGEQELMSATGKGGSRPDYMRQVKANSEKERQPFFTKYEERKDSKRCN